MQSCKTNKLSNGENSFFGTISYDINLKMNVDTIYQKDRSKFYGNRVDWTYFKNGDIQQKFYGSSSIGLDVIFWDLSENLIITKYNSSDTLFVNNSKFSNITKKLISPTLSKKSLKLLMKMPATPTKRSYYYTYSCDFKEAFKINPLTYYGFNYDNFYEIVSSTNGCIPLKYQFDYFTYQVNFISNNINNSVFKYNDKLHRKNPRVFLNDFLIF
jgi:hypothetical protein